MPLTPCKQRFVDEYIIDLHATAAAIRAGYSPRGVARMFDTTTALPGQLADNEPTGVRLFCGCPAYVSGNSGFQSWRFFTAYGALEFKLNNLAPAELAQVRVYLS